MIQTGHDLDITTATAIHPDMGNLSWERTKQDRRVYYRMLRNGRGTGSLTTAKGARETIAYWHTKGWTK